MTNILGKLNPGEWLLEEYKLQSAHYFHESSELGKSIALFTSMNIGLLAFIGSNFSVQNKITQIFIPLIGILISIFWIIIHIRIRECRLYIERRILEIEEALHKHWKNLDFIPLDIRTYRSWNTYKKKHLPKKLIWIHRIIRNIPSSISELILPISFGVMWTVIIFINIYQRSLK